MLLKITSTLLMCLLFIVSSFGQNLVRNGTFSKGLKKWNIKLTDENIPVKIQNLARKKFFDNSGLKRGLDIDFVELTANSLFAQDLLTEQLESYTLVFAMSHRPDAGDKQLVVFIDGIAIHKEVVKSNQDMGAFLYKNIHFKSPSNNATITFYLRSLNGDDSKGILITDVVCQKTSEINLEEFSSDKFASK